MRLDKFLKVSRIIKRRTLAKEACDRQQVKINGRVAKAGTEVQPGDILELSFGQRRLKIKITAVQETVPAKQAAGLYTVLEDKRLEDS
ncbi:RNA-binding S4 domain-containing protein [Desulfallas thermosapovorans]|uniref:RQC P-site tRNA stabilizing factor n=1 Tax=Desulfallas thermosapovorans DSM 6562 TaxID=1121431 RepID=A0A5S4ZVE7_9FIRM|nr:RNA-binding S4 domain-containing protein [Desulfallas thermosapovorans]TYO96961.1 ribosomal 50S subunit-recycling heat shock protein [Desulfallas thermosapovorans DSM 6562]